MIANIEVLRIKDRDKHSNPKTHQKESIKQGKISKSRWFRSWFLQIHDGKREEMKDRTREEQRAKTKKGLARMEDDGSWRSSESVVDSTTSGEILLLTPLRS